VLNWSRYLYNFLAVLLAHCLDNVFDWRHKRAIRTLMSRSCSYENRGEMINQFVNWVYACGNKTIYRGVHPKIRNFSTTKNGDIWSQLPFNMATCDVITLPHYNMWRHYPSTWRHVTSLPFNITTCDVINLSRWRPCDVVTLQHGDHDVSKLNLFNYLPVRLLIHVMYSLTLANTV